MSTRARATIIGMFGPSIQGAGLLWMLGDAVLNSGRDLTLRYVLFDPGHLMVAVGVALTVICLPIAFQVAAAEPEELGVAVPPDPLPSEESSREQPEYVEGSWEAVE